MGRDRKQVGVAGIEGDAADTLRRVAMEQSTRPASEPGDFRDRLDHPCFIVGAHDRNELAFAAFREQPLQGVEVDHARRCHRDSDGIRNRREDRVVLDRAHENAGSTGRGACKTIGLRTAAGKNDRGPAGEIERRPYGVARLLDRQARLPARAMYRGRVAAASQYRRHGVDDRAADRGGRIVIEIDNRRGHWIFLSSATR